MRRPVVGLLGVLLLVIAWYLRAYFGRKPSRKTIAKQSTRSKPKTPERTKRDSRETKLEPDPSLPDLILLMGIPGSGKSTWAKKYVFQCDASFVIVSSDDVRKQLTGQVSDQSRNDEVWEIVFDHLQSALRNHRNVILDATNTSTDKRRRLLGKLPPCNRYAKIFQVNKSIARNRITRDIEAGVDRAQVPDAVIDKMQAQFNESLQTMRDEGWLTK